MMLATSILLSLVCLGLLIDLGRAGRQIRRLEKQVATARRLLEERHPTGPSITRYPPDDWHQPAPRRQA